MTMIAISALVFAALFAGAAGYISLVEHPARLRLDDGPLLAQWQPSYALALPIQSALAILGGVAGLIVWFMSGGWVWAFGSAVLLANWPFTLVVIMPTNKQLKAVPPHEAGPMTRKLLLKWGKLHNFRSGLGLVATMLFAGALARMV